MEPEGYVVGYRALGLLYAALLCLGALATFWYAGSLLQAAFLGAYVGTTVLIAGLTLFVLSVGPSNVSFGRS